MRAAGGPGSGKPDAFVELRNVSLTYGGDTTGELVLEGLDLEVRRGEFAAVVGPSGCGKSTLMKLMSGLLPARTGDTIVAGEAVAGPLKIVGMAFQNPTLLLWRSTLDNVLLPLEIVEPHRRRLRSQRAAYVAAAEELLALVGLSGYGDHYPWQLSGGMQQRASLCRALIHEPDLLMLDEPFAALDAFTREELWCVLRDLWQRKQFTVILVTHDLREAVFLADTVHVMSARPGRIEVTRENDLPRPREPDICYTPEFVAIVQELRDHIAQFRVI